MKRPFRSLAGALLVSLLIVASASPGLAQDQAKAAYGLKDLNEQSVMALVWMQASAEYRALCYQACNLADMLVDKAVAAAKRGDKPLAIICDLDETLLDNSAYDSGFIGRNDAYSGKTWTQWEIAAQAGAMPGAADFLNDVRAKHVEVFYVTNRDQAGLEGTIRNLQDLGYPYADAKHVLVTTGSSDKQGRFDIVARDFMIVVYMGDNANDFPFGTWHKGMKERNDIVDQNKARFATQFVVLPNPSYGDWEGALAGGYYGLSPQAKSDARKSVLKTWTAPQ
ncbi:MAG: 5'-nucleotidase, lipoprotein e(P4) family [Spirochaetia bacterium]|jgi:5'-nucleotidase (lipoprotein e(P4) family)